MTEPPGTVVVTGPTGVLGAALLDELSEREVTCLSHTTALSRRHGHLPTQIIDIAEPRLGLRSKAYTELAARTSVIVHLAAITDFGAPPDQIWRVNLQGTQRITEFAIAAQARLIHVSTAPALFADSVVTRSETSAAGKYIAGRNAYVQSKARAEELIKESGAAGVIVRPAGVIGDSHTGRIERLQGFHRLVGALCANQLPIVPFPPHHFIDFLPQDIVAAAIAALIRNEDQADSEYWLTAGPAAPTIKELVDAASEVLAMAGGQIGPVRYVEPDLITRLVLPAFGSELPSPAVRMLRQLVAQTGLIDRRSHLPSSLEKIKGGSAPPSRIELVESFRCSVSRYFVAPRHPERSTNALAGA